MAIHRSQWIGLASTNLNTQGFSISGPINAINSGLGATLVRDKIGHQSTIYFTIDYSYIVKLKEYELAFGVKGGGVFGNLDGAKLRAPEGSYGNGNVNHNDLILPETGSSGAAGDLGVGISFSGKGLRAGIAMNHLLNSDISIDNTSGSSGVTLARTLFASAGYDLKISRKLTLPIDLTVRTDFVRTQADFQARLVFNRNIWVGTSFRGYSNSSFDAVSLLFGFHIKKTLAIGYGYDISTSSLSSFNTGSHEIFISFKKPVKQSGGTGRTIYNPRYL